MVDEQRAQPRLVRPVAVTQLVDLHQYSDVGRGPLQVDVDFAGHLLLWSAERRDLGSVGAGTYRFLHFDQQLAGRLPIPATRVAWPHLARTPTGWLVYSVRASDDADNNCTRYSARGNQMGAFHAGDAIEDLQVTPAGDIWVSYGDEGIYGDVSPVSHEGLACFSPAGEVRYGFHRDHQQHGLTGMSHCYALNIVSDRETWAYYYGSFNLIRIENRRVTGNWDASAIRGSRAVAVDGRRALFAGKYALRDRDSHIVTGSLEHQHLYLLTLDSGEVEILEPRDNYGRRVAFDEHTSLGRGSRLYLRAPHAVYCVDLADQPDSEIPAC